MHYTKRLLLVSNKKGIKHDGMCCHGKIISEVKSKVMNGKVFFHYLDFLCFIPVTPQRSANAIHFSLLKNNTLPKNVCETSDFLFSVLCYSISKQSFLHRHRRLLSLEVTTTKDTAHCYRSPSWRLSCGGKPKGEALRLTGTKDFGFFAVTRESGLCLPHTYVHQADG